MGKKNAIKKIFLFFVIIMMFLCFGLMICIADLQIDPPLKDTDGDGLYDFQEDVDYNANLSDDDTDSDGTPNYQDQDDDNDGFWGVIYGVSFNDTNETMFFEPYFLDCDVLVNTTNPNATEICDDIDNNCNFNWNPDSPDHANIKAIDEHCDDDDDDYCVATKTVVGTPSVCPNGGGDSDDNITDDPDPPCPTNFTTYNYLLSQFYNVPQVTHPDCSNATYSSCAKCIHP